MSSEIAIGFSQTPSISEAITQACISAKNQLKQRPADFVLILACPSHIDNDILNIAHAILKPKRLIGCSTAGIILSEGNFNRGIAVLAIISTDISFGVASSVPNPPDDDRQAGVDWGHRLVADSQRERHEGCLIFTDHLTGINPSFVLGIQEVLGTNSLLAGAVASDDLKFNKTYQFFQRNILTQSILGLLIDAHKIAFGNTNGFKPLGKPRTITKADKNTIISIDNQPAINIYKEFLGKDADLLNTSSFGMHSVLYPLGIYLENQRKYLIKNAIDITMEGSIVVTGDVPSGAEVHLMIGNKDSCRHSAMDAATQVKEALGGSQAKLIFVIESVGRQRILKHNPGAQIITIKEVLGYTTPIIGMYSFGEITPLSQGGHINSIHLQNGSITIIAID